MASKETVGPGTPLIRNEWRAFLRRSNPREMFAFTSAWPRWMFVLLLPVMAIIYPVLVLGYFLGFLGFLALFAVIGLIAKRIKARWGTSGDHSAGPS